MSEPPLDAPHGSPDSNDLHEPSLSMEFDNLPQPIVVSDTVARPVRSKKILRRAAHRAEQVRNRDAIKKQRIRFVKLLVGSALLATGLGLAGYWIFTLAREVPKESWATVIPGMQTPNKLQREYKGICAAFQEISDTIDDARSRDRAIPKLLVVAARYRGVPSRIAAAGRPTEMQLDDLGPNFNVEIDVELDHVKTKIDRLRRRSLLLSGELLTALGEVSAAIDDAVSAMRLVWRPLPEATSAAEQLEREIAIVESDLWSHVASVGDEIAYVELTSEFVVAASRLDEIQREVRASGHSLDPTSSFLIFSQRYADDIEARLTKLHSRFGSLRGEKSLQRYRDAWRAISSG